MAFKLNSIDLTTYGITAVQKPGSNIALDGCFDLPSRIGDTFHDWGDSDGIEEYTDSVEIFFTGRDIQFTGALFGTRKSCGSNLQTFYNAISAASGGLSILETPYNSASGYVKSVTPELFNGAVKIQMIFREPVVTLTGILPASGTSNYTIDSIPFSSFGLYLSKAEALFGLPELKEQLFTKYGSEGYQITKRKNKTLDFNGFVAGNSLADFQSKVNALYLLFSQAGTRKVKINNELYVTCFADQGFTIDGIYVQTNNVIGIFKISLKITTLSLTSF